MPRRTQAYARAHSSATRAKPLWRSNMKDNVVEIYAEY